MNIENINKIIESLKTDTGNHFIMANFADYLNGMRAEQYVHCNTAMCICGWANHHRLAQTDAAALTRANYGALVADEEKGAAWLGIDWNTGHELFFLKDTFGAPLFESLETFDAEPPEKKRAAGIKVLEILRDTGEVNWSAALDHAGIEAVRDQEDEDPDDDY